MLENIWSAISLVHIAAATQVVGFLVRDQLILRALILLGTILYIVYYYLEPEAPLWDAIACGVVMAMANLYTMIRMLSDRRPGVFDEEDLLIYGAIRQIAPGEFKRLMGRADKRTAMSDMVLTEEGLVPEYLYFLVGGDARIEKLGHTDNLRAPLFIGEVSYLLNQPATATVTMKAGGRFARWKVSDLRAFLNRHERLQGALEIALNRDLAGKVAASRPPALA